MRIRQLMSFALVALPVLAWWPPTPAGAAPLYGTPATLVVDGAPVSLGAIDLDNDGDLDLLTANQSGEGGPSLSVLPNNGNGSFAGEERLSVNGAPYILEAMSTGDFDADGYGDVTVAVDDVRNFPPTGMLLVYLNDGSGQFLKPMGYPLGGILPTRIRSADVDGDGRLDLVVCHVETVNGAGVISILLGNSDGSFRSGARVLVGSIPTDAVVADVDQDGRKDVLVVDPAAEGLFILYGTGGGSLVAAPVAIPDAGIPSGVALRRVESDALPALVVANASGSELLVLQQTSARQFEVDDSYVVDAGPSGLEVYDFNGRPLAALPSFSGDQLLVVELGVEGTVDSVPVDSPSDVVVADLDGDIRPDLAVISVTNDHVRVALAGSGPAATATPTPDSTQAPPASTPTLAPTGSASCTPGPGCDGGSATAAPSPTRTPTVPAVASTSTPTATATHTAGIATGEPGDANCDGTIDEFDAFAIFEQLFLQQCEGADVNGDGMVTAADLILFFMGEAFR